MKPSQPRARLAKLAVPFLGSVLLGAALYFGGSAYQTIGLAALDRTWVVLGYALGVGQILFLAVLFRRLVQYVVLDGIVASALGSPVPGLLSQLSALLVYLVAFAAIAGIVFEQDLTFLWAASGVAGFVFGFALREIILDAFTGLAINLDNAIKIGDCIQIHKSGDQVIEGKVLEISWRTTRLADLFRNVVIVPNSKLAGATVTNYSVPGNFYRQPIAITLDIEVPPERAFRILEAGATEGLAGFEVAGAPAPMVWVRDITPTGVDYTLNIFVAFDGRLRARSAVLLTVWRHLAAAGIRPAWPKLERAEAAEAGARRPQAQVPREQIEGLLAAVDLFRDLGRAEIALLAETAGLRVVPAGTTLVQSGEAAAAMALIVEGLLAVEPGRAGDGREEAAATLGPGSLIGAQALLMGEAQRHTVRTRTVSLVCEIDQAALHRLLLARPEAAGWLSRRLAERIARDEAAPGGVRRLQSTEGDLAAEVLGNLRRFFADLRLH